jgi:hypothetical protein
MILSCIPVMIMKLDLVFGIDFVKRVHFLLSGRRKTQVAGAMNMQRLMDAKLFRSC